MLFVCLSVNNMPPYKYAMLHEQIQCVWADHSITSSAYCKKAYKIHMLQQMQFLNDQKKAKLVYNLVKYSTNQSEYNKCNDLSKICPEGTMAT